MSKTKDINDNLQDKFSAKFSKVVGDRIFFTEREDNIPLPDLIDIQKNSFNWFVDEGIKDIFEEISPIKDFSDKKIELHLLDYRIEDPKISPDEAKYKMLSYEGNIVVKVRLVNKETGELQDQEVFLGVLPIMTEKGTFIVNGIERVIVNQLVRSPGAFYSKAEGFSGYYNCKIIPKRGAWLEFETDKKGIIYAKIDRKRKILATHLLRVFGFSTNEEIIKITKDLNIDTDKNTLLKTLEKDTIEDVKDAYQSVYKKIRPGDMATAENAKALINSMFFDFKRYDFGPIARYKLNKRFNLDTPSTIEGRVFQKEDLEVIIKELARLNHEGGVNDDIDHLGSRRVRSVGELIQNKFRIGLLRTDRIAKDRMTIAESESITPNQIVNSRPVTAALREFFASSQLSQFMDQTNPLSELAHKRRLSAMGPGGLSRERASFDVRDVHQSHYGRICPISTPEGPNIGLVVHLATYAKVNSLGFIMTPFKKVSNVIENTKDSILGRNITEDIEGIIKKGEIINEDLAGKISALKNKKEILVRKYVTSDVEYYSAEDERDMVIAQANSKLDNFNQFVSDNIPARHNCEPLLDDLSNITHIDVSPKQIISEVTALIPFLEHDDNTRASMGSNMQRQAVPLIFPEAPIVGTGMEKTVAKSTGQCYLAPEDGEIISVDANQIVLLGKSGKRYVSKVPTFVRTNQSTCFNMRVNVFNGQKVKKGDILTNGASIDNGEVAIGRNLLVAYMVWEGCNFEDAIIISDKVVQRGYYDSIHIDDYTIDVRETKLGPEIITRDIPNVSEKKLAQLDADGIIRIGAYVEEGDVLVGKITPKGETELSPEERLIQAIFGEKAKDVKDSSLRLPGGGHGKVVNVQIFSRDNGDELPMGCLKQVRIFVAQTRKIQVGDKMAGRHGNKGVVSTIVPSEDMPFLSDGTPVDIILNPLGVAARMNIGQILETHLGWIAREKGVKFATPVLNGIKVETIESLLDDANLPSSGKVKLFNGKTGEPFMHDVNVGIKYMLKLNHLVEDKIHARSVGPYSIVTQQPLGGKAQHGGQRFGEMEVWALEAYGATHILQEMLTIKSDDVIGRSKAYESIVKGESIKKPNTPESFNVLVNELKALGINVNLYTKNNMPVKIDFGLDTNVDEFADSDKKISDLETDDKETDEDIVKDIDGLENDEGSMEEEIKESVEGIED